MSLYLCADVYLEGKLPVRDRFAYEAHVEKCPGCREHFDRTSAFIQDAHQIGKSMRRPGQIPQRVLDEAARLPIERQLLLGEIVSRDLEEEHQRLERTGKAQKKTNLAKPN
jgi:hypothetical protein